jgi:hypothetical protein
MPLNAAAFSGVSQTHLTHIPEVIPPFGEDGRRWSKGKICGLHFAGPFGGRVAEKKHYLQTAVHVKREYSSGCERGNRLRFGPQS